MAKQLRIVSGRDSGRLFHLPERKPFLIGRDMGTHTRLTDPEVSMLHCQLIVDANRVVLTDRCSTGGTFVGGQRVSKHELHPGDVFRVGDTRMRYEG
jgi:pSer/pThr/pTyr-binding forkhead associated (FHA) protein